MNTAPDRTGQYGFRSELYAWSVVALLCVGGMIALLDRQVLILLVDPIKASLDISDTQVALVQGFALAIFYGGLAIPLGRLADTGNRKIIIAVGAFFFSLSTMAGGFALTFGALFASRLCVGIGEATLSPAGTSLISDYFPPSKTSLAVGIYTSSSFVGTGLSLVTIGWFLTWLATNPDFGFPLIGRLEDWQMVFIAASIPGLLFAPAILLIKEPPRSDGIAIASSKASASIKEVLTFIQENFRLLGPIFLGLPLLAAGQWGFGVWTPTFFIRTYGWTAPQIGSIFGLMVTILSTSGVIFGGWMAARQIANGRTEGNLSVSMWGALCAAPFVLAFPLAGDPTLSLILLAPVLFFGVIPFGAGVAAIPVLAPNRMRAQLMAVYLLFANLIGGGLGPWMIAAFTDNVLKDPSAIRWSISIVGTVVVLAGAAIVGFGARSMRRALPKLKVA